MHEKELEIRRIKGEIRRIKGEIYDLRAIRATLAQENATLRDDLKQLRGARTEHAEAHETLDDIRIAIESYFI